MPLIRVRPQRVEHTDGWAVASFDREHMKYEEGGRVALVEVNDGTAATRVYTSTLAWRSSDGTSTNPTAEERAVIWPRLVEGMDALGITPELFDD